MPGIRGSMANTSLLADFLSFLSDRPEFLSKTRSSVYSFFFLRSPRRGSDRRQAPPLPRVVPFLPFRSRTACLGFRCEEHCPSPRLLLDINRPLTQAGFRFLSPFHGVSPLAFDYAVSPRQHSTFIPSSWAALNAPC